ncbi:MAG: glycosyltransferase [bacterium]|nr:glycosyltransferase [bacterium]
MRLLLITQKVNRNDSNLGFFHEWLKKIAEHVDHLYVICLEAGEYNLPTNVTVLSLGKPAQGGSALGGEKLRYAIKFFKYIWQYRGDYDGVFVHMNPEYVILGGLFWRLWHKKILLWYTHKAVNWRLKLAEKFVNKIFTASKESFRLTSKKLEVVGHGIDVDFFRPADVPNVDGLKLLTVGRVSASKDLQTLILAVNELCKKNISVSLDIVGTPVTSADELCKEELQKLLSDLDLRRAINWLGGVSHEVLPIIFAIHNLFLHTSRTGSMDKVVLEALAAGRIVVTSSEAYRHLDGSGFVFWFPPGDYIELAKTIEKIYLSGILKELPIQRGIDYVNINHNLGTLIKKIIAYFAI